MKYTQEGLDLRSKIEKLKVKRATARKVLEAEAKKQIQKALDELDLEVSEAFHEAVAHGISKNELGRWWGTKNFNTITKFLEMQVAPTALNLRPKKTRTETPVPMEILPDGTLTVLDEYEFNVGTPIPLNASAYGFIGDDRIKSCKQVVLDFIRSGVLP